MKEIPSTAWETSHKWYDALVGEKGHYYHQHLILPRSLRLLNLKNGDSLLDLGCGQGVLEKSLPKEIRYVGVDASPSLIQKARKDSRSSFYVADITKPLVLKEAAFTSASLILCLQNLRDPEGALLNAAKYLAPEGKLLIVMNHPTFRIPRQSSWGIDEAKKLQYRRLDLYMSSLEIPIQTHPGQKEGPSTVSFHHPLSFYFQILAKAGFVTEILEEWASDKKSSGPKAAMENRCRREFPLFLALVCRK